MLEMNVEYFEMVEAEIKRFSERLQQAKNEAIKEGKTPCTNYKGEAYYPEARCYGTKTAGAYKRATLDLKQIL